MNPIQKRKLYKCDSDNSKDILVKEIKKQNKLLITIGATIGIIAIIWIVIGLVISEGLRIL